MSSDTSSPGAERLPRLAAAGWGWLLLALGATAAVFATGLSGELVYDDLLLIGRNPWITDLAHIPSLFTRPYWDFLDPGTSEQIGYWRPLTAVAQALAWSLDGGAPWAFHAASLLLHLAATTVAFFLVRRLTRNVAIAGAAALLFGLHPTHVESVAWISALNDPLFGFFSLLSLHGFLRWRDGASGTRAPIGAAVAFFLALLSKEMAVAVLPLAAAIDLVRQPRPEEAHEPDTGVRAKAPSRAWAKALARTWLGGFRRLPEAYTPFAVALVAYIGCRMLVFGDLFAGLDRTPVHFGVGAWRLALLRLELLGGAFSLLIWPGDLRTFRPFRPELDGFGGELAALAGITLVAVALAALFVARRERIGLAALILIPLGFSPALINVGSLGRFPLSDRFLYLSVLGASLFVAWLLWSRLPRVVALGSTLVLAGVYGVQSLARIEVWQDEESLFETAVRESPRSAYLHWGLGRVYLKRLAETEDEAYLERALAVFERAGSLLEEAKQHPTDLYVTSADYLQTNLGLAHCYIFEGELDGYGNQQVAITILEDLERRLLEIRANKERARALGIRLVEPELDLELVYASLGQAYRLAGRQADAEAALKKALEVDPRCVEALLALGRVHSDVQKWDLAAEVFGEALELQPGDYETKLLLAQTLREGGQQQRAEELALELVERADATAEAALVLAANRLEEQKAREALTWIDRALELDPEHGHAWFFKAMAMQSLGVNPQATVEAFRRATEHAPDHFLAHYNYATLLLASGAHEAAIPYVVAAYSLSDEAAHLAPLASALTQLPIDSPDVFFALAAADGERDRLDAAELWLDRALEADPEHPDSLFQKGRLYRERGRHEEGLDHMRRACAGLPGNLPAHTEFGEYLWRQGLLIEAQRTLSACLDFPRDPSWSEPEYENALDLVRKLLGGIEEELPPSPTIGPMPPKPGS